MILPCNDEEVHTNPQSMGPLLIFEIYFWRKKTDIFFICANIVFYKKTNTTSYCYSMYFGAGELTSRYES